MDGLGSWWSDLHEVVRTIIAIGGMLLAAMLLERALGALLRRAYLRRIDRSSASLEADELARLKRQQTLGTMLESLIRYAVYGAAIVVVVAMVSGGRASAVYGASLVVVVVGFSLQRILADVIEGALLLFEGQLAVGDVITVHQNGGTGVVEEFTLRTTVLRTMAGDRIAIPNGGVTPFTRWAGGVRQVRLELLVSSLAGADVVREVCRAEADTEPLLWAVEPGVELVVPVEVGGASLHRVVVSAQLAPGLEQQAERLASMLEALLQARDLLVGPVTASQLRAANLDAWRAGLPIAAP